MKIFITCFLTFVVASLSQEAMAQTEEKRSPATLDHIAVYVADLKIATDFYESIFALEQIPEPFHDGKHTWFSLGTSSKLHLIQGAKTSNSFDKNEHLCFSVPSVNIFINKLKAKHINYENWAGAKEEITLRIDGVKQIYFQDPDGHWLEVNDVKYE